MQRVLSPLFDHSEGEGGEVGYPHGSQGGGMGGYMGGGDIKNPPVNYRRGGSIFDISKRSYQPDRMTLLITYDKLFHYVSIDQ